MTAEEKLNQAIKDFEDRANGILRQSLETLKADLLKVLGEKPAKKTKAAEPTPPAPETPKDVEPVKPDVEPTPHKEGGALTVADVTIEMLRATATKYAEIFGMEKLLALNVKHGSSKKLSGIDPKMYAVVYGEMENEIAEAAKKKAEAPKTEVEKLNAVLIGVVREKAAAYLAKNGEPSLKAVLKAFGAEKISGLAVEKYPAFLEAIGNA